MPEPLQNARERHSVNDMRQHHRHRSARTITRWRRQNAKSRDPARVTHRPDEQSKRNTGRCRRCDSDLGSGRLEGWLRMASDPLVERSVERTLRGSEPEMGDCREQLAIPSRDLGANV